LTKEEMQELRAMMKEVVGEELKPVKEDIAAMKEDIGIIKEEAQITRHSSNLLLKWAEKAERSLNVGLYEKE